MTYTMWSFGHYLFMASPFILWGVLHYLIKDKSYDYKRQFGVWVSLVGVVILLLRNIEIFVVKDFVFHYEIIPLQICHFANFVLLYAFLKDNKTMFAFAWLFNLPAAYMSILFSNGLENYETLLTFRGFAYITGHMLIVSLTLWAFSNGFIKLSKSILIKLFTILLPLYITAHIINVLFSVLFNSSSNYFYTMRPESGTPLELFYTLGNTYMFGSFEINPLYLLLTGLFGFIVILLIYGVTYYLSKEHTITLKEEA
ncbi:MAG: hypothetical protein ACOC1L_04270 [Bacillota bacterium]